MINSPPIKKELYKSTCKNLSGKIERANRATERRILIRPQMLHLDAGGGDGTGPLCLGSHCKLELLQGDGWMREDMMVWAFVPVLHGASASAVESVAAYVTYVLDIGRETNLHLPLFVVVVAALLVFVVETEERGQAFEALDSLLNSCRDVGLPERKKPPDCALRLPIRLDCQCRTRLRSRFLLRLLRDDLDARMGDAADGEREGREPLHAVSHRLMDQMAEGWWLWA